MKKHYSDLLDKMNEAATIISKIQQTTGNKEADAYIEEALKALSKAGMIILKEYSAQK